MRSLTTGALAAAGRKRRGYKEGGLAYGEITARGSFYSAVLPSQVHVFLNRICLRAASGSGRSFGWRAPLIPHPMHKSVSPRRRAALIQTCEGNQEEYRTERGALSHHRASRTGAYMRCKFPYRPRRKLARQAQRQHHADDAALPPRPRVALSIQTSSETAFP